MIERCHGSQMLLTFENNMCVARCLCCSHVITMSMEMYYASIEAKLRDLDVWTVLRERSIMRAHARLAAATPAHV